MGKQAKKKDPKSKGEQKKHNRATRGVNTKKQGPLWSLRQVKDKQEKIKTVEIRVPLNVGWNPDLMEKRAIESVLPEPYDSLHLDWADELRSHVAELNTEEGISAKVRRTNLSSGRYDYEVVVKRDDNNVDEEILYTINSPHNLNFGPAGKFSKRK